MSQRTPKQKILKEIALFLVLLLVGIIGVPIAVFWIGPQLLGEFGGSGFSEFFSTLSSGLRHGEPGAWMLVLSPYFGIQCLRLAALAWRAGRPPTGTARPS